jgi:hypothetical protein
VADDGDQLAASLAGWLDAVSIADQDAAVVTETLVDAVARWGRAQGWRVYRRAPSVFPLPPPVAHRQSVVDVGCARAGAPPIVIEVDGSDRQRTIDKLLAEARSGRIALWVRWGEGPFVAPPRSVHLAPVAVTSRRDPNGGRMLHSSPAAELPAPAHTDGDVDGIEQAGLFGA